MFKVCPHNAKQIIANNIDRGIETTTINVERLLPKNSKIINAVRIAASVPSKTTL